MRDILANLWWLPTALIIAVGGYLDYRERRRNRPKQMIIAIDFDETIRQHADNDVPGAVDWIHRFQANGAKVVLWTNRTLITLWIAKRWCKSRDLTFWAINKLWWQKFIPWSPKIYADVFIDDRGYGCPTIDGIHKRIVDWSIVGPGVLAKITK